MIPNKNFAVSETSITGRNRNYQAMRPEGMYAHLPTVRQAQESETGYRFADPGKPRTTAMLGERDDAINRRRCLSSIREAVSQLVSNLRQRLCQIQISTPHLRRDGLTLPHKGGFRCWTPEASLSICCGKSSALRRSNHKDLRRAKFEH